MNTCMSRHHGRTLGKVCSWVAALLSVSAESAATAPEASSALPTPNPQTLQSLREVRALAGNPLYLPPSDGLPGVLAYPPQDTSAPASVTVFLHGMCDTPQNECPYFASSVTRKDWLLCPRADANCTNGGATWGWRTRQQTVELAIERIRLTYPGALDDTGARTLIGFSLGSFAALDVAHQGAGKWKYLLLIGAKILPNARLLERAGVHRVLLASGDFDMMKSHMVEQSRLLDRRGMPSAYRSLGRVGHTFAPDMDIWMTGALTWLHADEERPAEPSVATRSRSNRTSVDKTKIAF